MCYTDNLSVSSFSFEGRMRKVRMADIAEVVVVSKVTASKVLSRTSANNTKGNAKTPRKILDVARLLGYQPNIAAKQLVGQEGKLIGVLNWCQRYFNESLKWCMKNR